MVGHESSDSLRMAEAQPYQLRQIEFLWPAAAMVGPFWVKMIIVSPATSLRHRALMSRALLDHAVAELAAIRDAGLWKRERAIASPQGGGVVVAEDALPGAGGHNSGGVELLTSARDNYLGLADHPRLIAAAQAGARSHGFGMASVRFICGTQDLHWRWNRSSPPFCVLDEAILFSSCFDANGGVFEALLGAEDAISFRRS